MLTMYYTLFATIYYLYKCYKIATLLNIYDSDPLRGSSLLTHICNHLYCITTLLYCYDR